MIHRSLSALAALALSVPSALADPTEIVCGNLVYGSNQTSVCFANTFLSDAAKATNLRIARDFKRVKLGSDEVFATPLTVFTGEGDFTLSVNERDNMKKYLMNGGFMITSPGCSDAAWNRAFKRELAAIMPGFKLETIPFTHEIFSTVHTINELRLAKSSGSTKLQGLFIDGRLAILYSPEGLNNARNAKGCCCCGGNEIKLSREVNVNAVAYALLH